MQRKPAIPALAFMVMAFLMFSATVTAASDEADKAALRANDIATLNNLMGRHVWYHSAFLNDVELAKVWVQSPEFAKTAVWAQNSNYWIGMDNIKGYYGPSVAHDNTRSQFQFHSVTSGVVEVAADRKTAKGVWYTPGAIGGAGGLTGLWERYGIDFVNENGEWKIWHLHVYTDFGYSLKSGNGGGMGGPPGGMGGPPPGAGAPPPGAGGPPPGAGGPPPAAGGAEDQGTEKAEKFGMESGGGTPRPMMQSQATADPGYQELGENSYPDLIPRPPEPYATFSDTWSYGDPDEVKMFSGPYREWSEIKKQYNK